MPAYGYVTLIAGWILWSLPFLLARRRSQRASQVDRRARWGIALVAVAYAILWQGKFWERDLSVWRFAISVVFLLLAILLCWSGVRELGRHWRIDAGLNADHQLVTSGPYAVVRHPIYTSMLCMLLGTGFLISPSLLLILSLLVYIAGTEIRVRVEEQLLASRFGDTFTEYRRKVPAYIPLLR